MYCQYKRATEPHRLFNNLNINFIYCINIHNTENSVQINTKIILPIQKIKKNHFIYIKLRLLTKKKIHYTT